ncbi:hypothetical protein V8C86DRAFT_2437065 [Haematococcus lacustris]
MAEAGRRRIVKQQASVRPNAEDTAANLQLTRCIGLGVSSSALSWHRTPGILAYTAGPAVVVINVESRVQLRLLRASGHPHTVFCCCAVGGRDGTLVAAGEKFVTNPGSLGPAAVVWEASNGRQLAALRHHKHGVNRVSWSPDDSPHTGPKQGHQSLSQGQGRSQGPAYHASVNEGEGPHPAACLVHLSWSALPDHASVTCTAGAHYDAQLCLWDWQNGTLLAKVSAQVWGVNGPVSVRTKQLVITPGSVSLAPKPIRLGDLRASNFVDVRSAPGGPSGPASTAPSSGPTSAHANPAGSVYALTSTGTLLLLRGTCRVVDKTVNLQVPAAYALAVSTCLVACGCAGGVVRLFATRTLQFKSSLPRPSPTLSAVHRTNMPAHGGGGSSSATPDTLSATGANQGSGARGKAGMAGGPRWMASPSSPGMHGSPGLSLLAGGQQGGMFPDALALAFDSAGEQLAVAYSDRSLLIWDVRSPVKAACIRCLMSHSAAIWDAALLPAASAVLMGLVPPPPAPAPQRPSPNTDLADRGSGETLATSSALVTCAADGTIRLWSLQHAGSATTNSLKGAARCMGRKVLQDAYLHAGTGAAHIAVEAPGVSSEAVRADEEPVNYAKLARTLRGVMYAGQPDSTAWLLDPDPSSSTPKSSSGQQQQAAAPGKLCAPESPLPGHGSAVAMAAGEQAVQLRCLRLSRDATHLSTGDVQGNVRVYDLHTRVLVAFKEAHESAILALDYSPPQPQLPQGAPGSKGFLATGGRDAVIHVFDVASGYQLVNTLEDHSAAVTSVRFSACGGQLLSAGADRALIFRRVVDATDCSVSATHKEYLPAGNAMVAMPAMSSMTPVTGGRGVIYDMAIDDIGQRVVVATQGGFLRLFDLRSGLQLTSMAQVVGSGEAVRVGLDPSGQHALCACSDGTITLYALPVTDAGPSLPSKPAAGSYKFSDAPALAGQPRAGTAAALQAVTQGTLLAKASGHGEVATAVTLLHNCNTLVSTGGDGCILQWTLPPSLVARLQAAQAQLPPPPPSTQATQPAALPPTPLPALSQPLRHAGQQPQAVTWLGGDREAAAAVVPPASRSSFSPRPAEEPLALEDVDAEVQLTPAVLQANKAVPCMAKGPQPVLNPLVEPDTTKSRTFQRAKAGMPLLSTDKLPRWAAQRAGKPRDMPTLPATPRSSTSSRSTSQGLSSVRPWADDLEEGDDIVLWDEPDAAGAVGEEAGSGSRPGSAGGAPQSMGQAHAACGPFNVEQNNILSSSADELEGIEDGLEELALGESPICPASGGGSNRLTQRAAAAAGAVEDDSQSTVQDGAVTGAAEDEIKRDLFSPNKHSYVVPCGVPCRQHFGCLDQASGTTTPASIRGLADAGRHSLTAAYRQLAKSLLAAGPEALGGPIVGLCASLCPTYRLGQELCTATKTLGLLTYPAFTLLSSICPGHLQCWFGKEWHRLDPTLQAPNTQQSSPLLAQESASEPHTAAVKALVHTLDVTSAYKPVGVILRAKDGAGPSTPGLDPPTHEQMTPVLDPSSRPLMASPVGRAGRMESELAKMRERLCSLQRTFAEQQARSTPWRAGRHTRCPSGALDIPPNTLLQPPSPRAENGATTPSLDMAPATSAGAAATAGGEAALPVMFPVAKPGAQRQQATPILVRPATSPFTVASAAGVDGNGAGAEGGCPPSTPADVGTRAALPLTPASLTPPPPAHRYPSPLKSGATCQPGAPFPASSQAAAAAGSAAAFQVNNSMFNATPSSSPAPAAALTLAALQAHGAAPLPSTAYLGTALPASMAPCGPHQQQAQHHPQPGPGPTAPLQDLTKHLAGAAAGVWGSPNARKLKATLPACRSAANRQASEGKFADLNELAAAMASVAEGLVAGGQSAQAASPQPSQGHPVEERKGGAHEGAAPTASNGSSVTVASFSSSPAGKGPAAALSIASEHQPQQGPGPVAAVQEVDAVQQQPQHAASQRPPVAGPPSRPPSGLLNGGSTAGTRRSSGMLRRDSASSALQDSDEADVESRCSWADGTAWLPALPTHLPFFMQTTSTQLPAAAPHHGQITDEVGRKGQQQELQGQGQQSASLPLPSQLPDPALAPPGAPTHPSPAPCPSLALPRPLSEYHTCLEALSANLDAVALQLAELRALAAAVPPDHMLPRAVSDLHSHFEDSLSAGSAKLAALLLPHPPTQAQNSLQHPGAHQAGLERRVLQVAIPPSCNWQASITPRGLRGSEPGASAGGLQSPLPAVGHVAADAAEVTPSLSRAASSQQLGSGGWDPLQGQAAASMLPWLQSLQQQAAAPATKKAQAQARTTATRQQGPGPQQRAAAQRSPIQRAATATKKAQETSPPERAAVKGPATRRATTTLKALETGKSTATEQQKGGKSAAKAPTTTKGRKRGGKGKQVDKSKKVKPA